MRNIFLTGATGFLGRYMLREILSDEDTAATVLVRSKRGTSASQRIESVLKYLYGVKYKAMASRVKVIDGEVNSTALGLDDKSRRALAEKIDEIYHSAAIAEFRIPLDVIRKTNVAGTGNILEFALECKKTGRLKRVNHISTSYVAGTYMGTFCESDLNIGQKFNNTYEQSKFEAELLANEYRKKGLEVNIFRPSILIGEHLTGRTNNFKMFYQPLHFFNYEIFDAIPANRNAKENLISVDVVTKQIWLIANMKDSVNKTFHIGNPSPITAGHFIDLASDFFGFHKPEFVPVENFDMHRLSKVQRLLIEPFVPYFNYNVSFGRSNTDKLLNRISYECPIVDDEILIRLFKFCADSSYIKPKRHYVTTG